MKDEAGGRIIEAFVGLTAKLYSYKMFDNKTDKKMQGCQEISYQENHHSFSGRKHLRTMNVIRSHKHEIFSETVNKVALSGNDDKRFIRSDKISTYAWGHYGIEKEKQKREEERLALSS